MSETPRHSIAAPIDIAGLMRPDDTMIWSGGAAEPLALLSALEAQLDRTPRGSVFLGFGLAGIPDAKRLAAAMRIKALGGAGGNRGYQDLGALDVLPAHYSALPDMVAGRRIAIDTVLVQLARNGAGQTGLALMIDHVADAIPLARVVVAEVNDRAPYVPGDIRVDAADIDHVVHVSHQLPELPSVRASGVALAIGEMVATLVPDGATVQVGLGSLPDAVLECLAGKRDLGIHCGTISDRVADLVDAGVVTNRRKSIDQGLTVAAGLLGTQRLYRWAHENERLRLRSSRYTHGIDTTSAIDNLCAINSALEIDLTGQMNAEMAGARHVGLVGGHADFLRGAMRSKGGRGLVVLESTAQKGRVSRIVPRLAGGIVTTSRSDADIVVTEYGIAELAGRSVRERAQALIAIAHPDFRPSLLQAAESVI